MWSSWSFSPTEMSSPSSSLDSTVLPWSTLASGGEGWVLMPWRSSGFLHGSTCYFCSQMFGYGELAQG